MHDEEGVRGVGEGEFFCLGVSRSRAGTPLGLLPLAWGWVAQGFVRALAGRDPARAGAVWARTRATHTPERNRAAAAGARRHAPSARVSADEGGARLVNARRQDARGERRTCPPLQGAKTRACGWAWALRTTQTSFARRAPPLSPGGDHPLTSYATRYLTQCFLHASSRAGLGQVSSSDMVWGKKGEGEARGRTARETQRKGNDV